MAFFLFGMLLLSAETAVGQGVTVTVPVPQGGSAAGIVSDIARDEARRAIQNQIPRLENLGDRAVNETVERVVPINEAQMQSCMRNYEACGRIIEQVDLCPNSPAMAPETTGVSASAGATALCPDGSRPDYQAMSNAMASCNIPPNCGQVMKNSMRNIMIRGVVQGVGSSVISNTLPALPEISIP